MAPAPTHRERALSYPELEDLREMYGAARQALVAVPATAEHQQVINAIGEAAASLRSLRLDPQKALEASIPYGALWGEEMRQAISWEWVWLTEIEDDQYQYYAIVPPGREYYIAPLFLLSHYVMRAKEDDTSVLLFNMLVAGQTPTSQPGAFLELS